MRFRIGPVVLAVAGWMAASPAPAAVSVSTFVQAGAAPLVAVQQSSDDRAVIEVERAFTGPGGLVGRTYGLVDLRPGKVALAFEASGVTGPFQADTRVVLYDAVSVVRRGDRPPLGAVPVSLLVAFDGVASLQPRTAGTGGIAEMSVLANLRVTRFGHGSPQHQIHLAQFSDRDEIDPVVVSTRDAVDFTVFDFFVPGNRFAVELSLDFVLTVPGEEGVDLGSHPYAGPPLDVRADFAQGLRLRLDLPPGYKFTTDSGRFLTPLPAASVLMAVPLAGLAVASRLSRRPRRRGAPPAPS